MTRFMSPRIVPYLGTGEVPQRTGAKDSVIAVYQAFDTQDKPLNLALGNDAIWKRFWQAVGQAAKGEDARHASNADRRAARAEIVADIQAILRTRPRDEWLNIFMEAKVPAGPVNSVDDLARDPELIARGLLYTADAGGRRVPQVGLGIGIDGVTATYRSPPPQARRAHRRGTARLAGLRHAGGGGPAPAEGDLIAMTEKCFRKCSRAPRKWGERRGEGQ